MKLLSFAKAAAMAILGTIIMSGCEKPGDGPASSEEPKTNYFIYNGFEFEINSAVQYDKGDNSVEIWLSPISGLTTSKEIKAGGDYVVFNTHRSYLGGRDRFSADASKDSYICFGEQKFAYGDQGTAYIEVTMTNDSLKVNFLAEVLQTKNSPVPAAMLSGSFAGTYSVEKEQPYANDWGFDREHTAIEKAVYTTREDEGDFSITLYEANDAEAIRIEMPEDEFGDEILLSSTQTTLKLYIGGIEFSLQGAAGTIKTSVDEDADAATVSISLVKDGRTLRAEYSGAYETETVKINRFIFDYEGESPYEGNHEIVKLMVEDKGGVLKLFFSPSEEYNIAGANSTHMPILTLPSSVINAGKKTFDELTDWEFAYDVMQSWPYDNEYKPHPLYSDWIEINRDGMEYEVEFILTGQATGMYKSTIDVYYKGEAR